MSEVKERIEIEGRVYTTIKLDVTRAIPLHAEFVSAMGSSLQGLAGDVDKDSGSRKLALAIIGALAGADTPRLFNLVPGVMAAVYHNETRFHTPVMNIHFGAYPGDLYPVFAWALAVNISPFLGGSAQGWKAFIQSQGWASQKGGKGNGSKGAQSRKAS